MELVEQIYIVTSDLPLDERFGLTSQIRRAAVSVPSNIAEGYKRSHRKEYLHFLSVADASVAKLGTQLILIGRHYPNIRLEDCERLHVEVEK